jgi:hypothetical protein
VVALEQLVDRLLVEKAQLLGSGDGLGDGVVIEPLAEVAHHDSSD